MDPYRLKLLSLSNEVTDRELVELKFICKQHIPVGVLERIKRPLELFDELENRNLLTPDNKEFLAAMLAGINRLELRDDLLGKHDERNFLQQFTWIPSWTEFCLFHTKSPLYLPN